MLASSGVILSRKFEMNPLNEESAVRNLGNAIGYGRLFQLAEQIWEQKQPGMAISNGPCTGMLVKCPCPDVAQRVEKHCSWCCGAGRVTKKVLSAMQVSQER